MSVGWFYAVDGNRKGPVSQEDLELVLVQGEIGRHSLVWRQGMEQWQALDTIAELQPLVALLPPELPPELPPPPLPPRSEMPTTPMERHSEPPVAPVQERAADEKSRPTSNQQTVLGRIWQVVWGGISNVFSTLGSHLGDAIWKWLIKRPIAHPGLVLSILSLSVYAGIQQMPENTENKSVGSGQMMIDANPWGEVEIRDSKGQSVALPSRTTPLQVTLQAGKYRVMVDYPHDSQGAKTCDLKVKTAEVATCWLDLAPVDANAYFDKIGW